MGKKWERNGEEMRPVPARDRHGPRVELASSFLDAGVGPRGPRDVGRQHGEYGKKKAGAHDVPQAKHLHPLPSPPSLLILTGSREGPCRAGPSCACRCASLYQIRGDLRLMESGSVEKTRLDTDPVWTQVL